MIVASKFGNNNNNNNNNNLNVSNYTNDCKILEFIGKNIAARRANGDLLFFTTSDMLPQNNLLYFFNFHLNNEYIIPNSIYLNRRVEIDNEFLNNSQMWYNNASQGQECPCNLPSISIVDKYISQLKFERKQQRMRQQGDQLRNAQLSDIRKKNFESSHGQFSDKDRRSIDSNINGNININNFRRNMMQQGLLSNDLNESRSRVRYVNKDCFFVPWNAIGGCNGDFQLIFKNDFEKVYGFLEAPQVLHIDSELCTRLRLIYKFNILKISDKCCLYHQFHKRSENTRNKRRGGCNWFQQDKEEWQLLQYGNKVKIKDRNLKQKNSKGEIITHIFVANKSVDDLWNTTNGQYIDKDNWGMPNVIIPEIVWQPKVPV